MCVNAIKPGYLAHIILSEQVIIFGLFAQKRNMFVKAKNKTNEITKPLSFTVEETIISERDFVKRVFTFAKITGESI